MVALCTFTACSTLMRYFTAILILSQLFTLGCSAPSAQGSYALTPQEKHWCDSLKIDPSVIAGVREYTDEPIEPFHYSLGKLIKSDGTEQELDPIYAQGFVFDAPYRRSDDIVLNLRQQLASKGYSIFVLDRSFGIEDKPDNIGVLKTADKYDVLRQIKTDGINWDIDNDSLITIIKNFDRKYALDLVGASGDWCEFVINKEPGDWFTFAAEVNKVCPDVVDQGTGTVEALAEEMKRTRRLYLWWD